MPKLTTRVAGVVSAMFLLVAVFLVASPGSSGAATTDPSGSAFGISATGLANIAPTPTAPPDATAVGVAIPGVGSVGALTATANLVGTAFTSTASVADVNLGGGQVTADLISSTCTADGTTLTGDSTFLNLAIPGLVIPVNPPPNTILEIPSPVPGSPPILRVVLNEQILSNGGQTLTVNALHVTAFVLTGAVMEDVILASSTCTLGMTTPTSAPTVPTSAPTAPVTTTTAPGGGGGGTAPGATPVPGSPSFTG